MMFSKIHQPKLAIYSEIQSLWMVQYQKNNFLLEKTIAPNMDQFPANPLLVETVNLMI